MSDNSKELLIHIGYHKTATTWLQKNLFESENKFFEPFSTTNNGHSSLAQYFIFDDDGYILSPFTNNINRINKEVGKVVSAKKTELESKIPVISHERLSGNPASSGFDAKKIACTLNKVFPKAKVLIVIREQASFIFSIYFQHLSTGGGESIKKFLNTKYDGIRPSFSPHHIDYLNLILEYHKLFGRDNVLVLPYEMFKFNPALFIKHLGQFLDVEINLVELKFKKVLNKKDHHFIKYYMRFLNLFTCYSSANNYSPLCNKYSKSIGLLMYKIFGLISPYILDTILKKKLRKQIDRWVGDRYIHSNKEISKLIGIELGQYGYYENAQIRYI